VSLCARESTSIECPKLSSEGKRWVYAVRKIPNDYVITAIAPARDT
jgi:hypothetical protein